MASVWLLEALFGDGRWEAVRRYGAFGTKASAESCRAANGLDYRYVRAVKYSRAPSPKRRKRK